MQDTCTDTSFGYLIYIPYPPTYLSSLQMDKNWGIIKNVGEWLYWGGTANSTSPFVFQVSCCFNIVLIIT